MPIGTSHLYDPRAVEMRLLDFGIESLTYKSSLRTKSRRDRCPSPKNQSLILVQIISTTQKPLRRFEYQTKSLTPCSSNHLYEPNAVETVIVLQPVHGCKYRRKSRTFGVYCDSEHAHFEYAQVQPVSDTFWTFREPTGFWRVLWVRVSVS